MPTNPPPIPASAPPPIAAGAVADAKPPTLSRSPDTGRKFPCKQCGARLDFDPSHRALKCPYCNFEEKIEPSAAKIAEEDFQSALEKQATAGAPIAGRSQEVRCPGCGAMVLLEDNVVTDKCPFCATHIENLPKQDSAAGIAPECLLPFAIASRDAVAAFNKWLASRWFAPGDLKQLANLGQLSGIYIPYWTYDSMTYSHYTGQRGDDYWETETYTEMENGRSVTKTRQVRRTRWTYVSGEVDHFFDDILVCASKSLPETFVNHLSPWDLNDLEAFRSDFLAGFKTERYVVDLAAGFAQARGIMDGEIRTLCCQDIGGDHQQVSSVNTQHVGVTFKHLLLPVWLAVYRYQNQTYRIAVNARTGEVVGTRPYSAGKIFLAVLAAVAVLAVIFAIVAMAHGR